jgi:copper chaperone CopZ
MSWKEVTVYTVPGAGAEQDKLAVKEAVETVAGVEFASMNIDTKNLFVRGYHVADADVRRAIEQAGYRALPRPLAPV